MTFEEFFKKKKISLDLLKAAEPALFAEFESHYNQMGEKSFDHTKKYWFNNLRKIYHAPDEPKVEKVVIENSLAEQTITESIIEQTEAPAAKLGFKPKFKTAATPPPASENAVPTPQANPQADTEQPAPAKLGFKPKFKTAASPAPDTAESTSVLPEGKPEINAEQPAPPKLGFKPKFKTATSPAPDTAESTPVLPEDKPQSDTEQTDPPKLGFKSKFKSAASPKPVDQQNTAVPKTPEGEGG